jgi:putative hemolysin
MKVVILKMSLHSYQACKTEKPSSTDSGQSYLSNITKMFQATQSQASLIASTSSFRARLASTVSDLREAQALRFEVFNIELDEGLPQSIATGLDVDAFDAVCDHLLVEECASGKIVGTYRLQAGAVAATNLGYYCQREFDLSGFEPMRSQILELGRACIHKDHRNFAVLNLLWKGIGSYAEQRGARYLIGCSSLTSQSEATGVAAYEILKKYVAPKAWRTTPLRGLECTNNVASNEVVKIPKLLSAYLTLGASICGPPAIDRDFKTIDFLTWIDTESPRLVAFLKRGKFVS